MGLFDKSVIFLLIFVMLFSGCVGQTTESIKNIITINNPYVQNTQPLAGTTTLIEFEVVKKGHGTGDVIVNFFDAGLTITGLKCQSPSVVQGNSCVLKNMVNNDIRLVTATLQAPPRQLIKSDTQYKVSYFIQHDYVSERTAMITVWDGYSITKPKTTFTQGDPTDGPIVLEFSQPSSGTAEGSDVPYRKDVPFEMKITANNVGSGSIAPQVIASGKLTVNKENLRVAFVEGEALKCDFNEAGVTLISSTTATLPATYRCYLVSSDAFTGYKTYTLSAYFTYTYQYSYTKVFTVKPTD